MIVCPDPARLAAAASGEDLGAERHAADCRPCRRALDDALALRTLAANLPTLALPAAHRRTLAAAVLAAADQLDLAPTAPPLRRVPRRYLAAALLAAALVVVALRRAAPRHPASAPATRAHQAGLPRQHAVPASPSFSPTAAGSSLTVVVPLAPPPPATAIITAGARARFVQRATADRDELVVDDGALTIDATAATRPLELIARRGPAEMRVHVDGARVAVRATHGALHSVQVFAGAVEIVSDGRTIVVTAGATWEAVPTGPRPAAAPAAPAAAAAAFTAGWAALDVDDLPAAITAFTRAATDPAVAEDARYWLAVSHARALDDAAASAAFAAFLAAYPVSPRAGDAHLALARLLATVDPAAARRHREQAATDRDPRIRAAAAAPTTSAPAPAPTAPAR